MKNMASGISESESSKIARDSYSGKMVTWACLPYSFANNTRISPQKCTTFLWIYFSAYFGTWMRAGQVNVNVNWNFGRVDKRTR
jgi:hypothetical protein